MNIPDFVPTTSPGRRLTDLIARNVPFGNDRLYVSLWLEERAMSSGVKRIVPWLYLYNDQRGTVRRLVRLPGAKLVELWDPRDEEWLEYPFVDSDVADDE